MIADDFAFYQQEVLGLFMYLETGSDIPLHNDTAIFRYFDGDEYLAFRGTFDEAKRMRYGENPHQKGVFIGKFDALFDQRSFPTIPRRRTTAPERRSRRWQGSAHGSTATSIGVLRRRIRSNGGLSSSRLRSLSWRSSCWNPK